MLCQRNSLSYLTAPQPPVTPKDASITIVRLLGAEVKWPHTPLSKADRQILMKLGRSLLLVVGSAVASRQQTVPCEGSPIPGPRHQLFQQRRFGQHGKDRLHARFAPGAAVTDEISPPAVLESTGGGRRKACSACCFPYRFLLVSRVSNSQFSRAVEAPTSRTLPRALPPHAEAPLHPDGSPRAAHR